MARSDRQADLNWRLEREKYKAVDPQFAALERARILLERQRKAARSKRLVQLIIVGCTFITAFMIAASLLPQGV